MSAHESRTRKGRGVRRPRRGPERVRRTQQEGTP